MKKTFKLIALLLTAALLCTALFACSDENDSDGEGTVTLIIGTEPEKVYTVDISKLVIDEGALSLVKHIASAEGIEFETSGSGSTTMLTRLDSLKENVADGTYLYFWTSVQEDFDVSEWAPENKTWREKTLSPSGVGISSMTVEPGAVIYIGTIKF